MPTKIDSVKISYTLKFTTPFHCGTGVRTGLVDRTMRRDGEDYLYVPGSTIKGSLRERCEQLARFFAKDADKKLIVDPHNAEEALRGLGHRPPTMVARIFGSQNMPGCLFFDDARLDEDDKKEYIREGHAEREKRAVRHSYKTSQVTPYTQVRLDRPTGTAVEGALYTSEFGDKNMMFHATIQGWLECTPLTDDGLVNEHHPAGTPTYSLLLLLAGLRLLDRLGGNKSTGKGHCSCGITKVQLNGHEIHEKTWKDWLDRLDALENYNELQEVDA